MSAYYNEIDPRAAEWLRELIRGGHIAPGVVDERSIEDVRPDDLRGYAQCHFFAGIGGWSYALRLAGWPDAQRDGQSLRGAEAPRGHDTDGRGGPSGLAIAESQQQHGCWDARTGRRQPTNDSELGNADDERSQRRSEPRDGADERAVGSSSMVGLEHTESDGREQRRSESGERSAFGGCWQSDWIACTDGKSRPVEPGTFPLAHGIPGRVGLLRGYGNAIVPQDAAEFIVAAS